jgi:outer membrane protein assembly factor BamD (BamD/ComL family)
MKSTRVTTRLSLLLAGMAIACGLAACASQQPVIPDGLSAAEIFQRAQDAVSRGNYALGIAYYSLVPTSFPDDKPHGAWAAYEIAFLYHKMGKNDTALSLTNSLLDQYTQAGDTLPQAPQILAQKLKTRLEALLTPPATPATAVTPMTAPGK